MTKDESLAQPFIDKSSALLIATALGWEPKRAWVGLTDEEIRRIELTVHGYRRQPLDVKAFACAIQAKLKQKNT